MDIMFSGIFISTCQWFSDKIKCKLRNAYTIRAVKTGANVNVTLQCFQSHHAVGPIFYQKFLMAVKRLWSRAKKSNSKSTGKYWTTLFVCAVLF